MSRFQHILILLVAFSLFSCKNYRSENNNIKADRFYTQAYAPHAQILDVRTIGEFRSGHLKNAMQADWLDHQQFEERTAYLDKNYPLYVYCMSGDRGEESVKWLLNQGFTTVKNLEGGLIAWKGAGKKLVDCKPHGKETTRESYDALISSAPNVIVNFGAEWSPTCKKMQPVLKEFISNNNQSLKVIAMDGSTEYGLMKELNVQALPTYILYRNGVEDSRKQGVLSSEELNTWVVSGNEPADSKISMDLSELHQRQK
jgi:rhodanese-related sulfurtransferase